MPERPILFSDPMVRAILAGAKTQTRRIARPQPLGTGGDVNPSFPEGMYLFDGREVRCPYGRRGDTLWVREAWSPTPHAATGHPVTFRATAPKDQPGPWKPSIHLRRRDARLVLRVEATRLERLHDITVEDARAEGSCVRHGFTEDHVNGRFPLSPISCFAHAWNGINGEDAWGRNSYVWVVSFSVVIPEVAPLAVVSP